MPRKHKVGEEISGYRIEHVFDPGAMALAYKARAPDGSAVFLKQYKSPSISTDWYEPYVAYQQELNRRIASSRARSFSVCPLGAFEASRPTSFWVAYEFVDGHDLEALLRRPKDGRSFRKAARDTWENRVVWAKLLMAAVSALHEANVVHADLKPRNVHLIPDSSIAIGFQLKLIDMDFSLLGDRVAPWLHVQGHVGTDGYRSPEHFIPGETPGFASDVFTCGLILYELLGDVNPYADLEFAEYQKRAMTHAAAMPRLRGEFLTPVADKIVVAETINRCLSPNPADRPSARDVVEALNGRADVVSASRAAPGTERAPIRTPRIRLQAGGGHTLSFGVTTPLGKELLKTFGDDCRYWASEQCMLEKTADNAWQIRPNLSAPNKTFLNGAILDSVAPIAVGDVIAVGSEKGNTKLPLEVCRE